MAVKLCVCVFQRIPCSERCSFVRDLMLHSVWCVLCRLWIAAVGFPETPVPAGVAGGWASACLRDSQAADVQGTGWCRCGRQTAAPTAGHRSQPSLLVNECSLNVWRCAHKSFWWVVRLLSCLLLTNVVFILFTGSYFCLGISGPQCILTVYLHLKNILIS